MATSPALPIAPLRLAVRAVLQQSDQARYLHHLNAVLLVALGQPVDQVASWLDCSPRSVERWVRGYRLGGCESLQMAHGAGRPSLLTAPQLRQLHDDLAAPPMTHGFQQQHWCGKLVAAHIERRHGVRLSLRQCQRLLRDLGRSEGLRAAWQA